MDLYFIESSNKLATDVLGQYPVSSAVTFMRHRKDSMTFAIVTARTTSIVR